MRVICCSLKMKEIPISKKKKTPALFIWRSKHVQYVSLSPRGANSAWLSFDTEESILYEPCCLCIPSRPLCLHTPNSRHYPRSFSKPRYEPLSDPFPVLPAHVQALTPMPEASFGSLLTCNISAGAAFLWGWPGSNGSDFPGRGAEMGGLTHPLICYTL